MKRKHLKYSNGAEVIIEGNVEVKYDDNSTITEVNDLTDLPEKEWVKLKEEPKKYKFDKATKKAKQK